MQTNFCSLHFTKIIFVSFVLSFSFSITPFESTEKARKEVFEAQKKVTNRFDAKLTQKQTELELCIATVKTESLYGELKTALENLHKDPAYELYKVTHETHTFIKELENYNKAIIRPELLTKINTLLEQLKTFEIFSLLRSTLKKQRVALLELFEEKELILSVEKILHYQNKELAELVTKQQKTVIALPSYKHVQELQESYLKTKSVKKLLLCIEKKQELLLQQQSALLKNKEYQKTLNTYERLTFAHTPSSQALEPEDAAKKELLKLQYELFIIPLENIL